MEPWLSEPEPERTLGGPVVAFAAHECTCDHAAYLHDDGFGCTMEGCQCLAGWYIAG